MRRHDLALIAAAFAVALTTACDREQAADPSMPPPVVQRDTITIGDIYPDDPEGRAERLQPLAGFLGSQLQQFGITQGRVRVSADIASMAELMKKGDVDVLIDSAYPVLAVDQMSGGQVILLNEAQDDATYWSVFIARSDNDVRSFRDLLGSVVVFHSPHSTSGFLLPAAQIMESGFTLRGANAPDAEVGTADIGCYFSGEEASTVKLVLSGAASVGAISNQDFDDLPPATREELKVIARTRPVPRQLVAVRGELGAPLVAALKTVLLGLTESDREKLRAEDGPLAWTWKFAPLTNVMQGMLSDLENRFRLLPECGQSTR